MGKVSSVNLLDSEAYFWDLVAKRGLSHFASKFEHFGWTTAGAFTYACGVNPAAVPDETFNARVIVPLCPRKKEKSKYVMDIRRLWHLCQQLHEADARRVHEGTPGQQAASLSEPCMQCAEGVVTSYTARLLPDLLAVC